MFIEKLDQFEAQFPGQKPISALYDKVKVQKKDNEELMQNMAEQESMLQKLFKNGHEIVGSLEDAPEGEALAFKITELEKRWRNLHTLVAERNDQLQKVEPNALKYREQADSLLSALIDGEKEVEMLEPLSVNIDNIAKQKEKVQQIRGLVDKLKLDVSFLKETVEDLKEGADEDIPDVEAEVEGFVLRVERLSVSLDRRGEQLHSLEGAAVDYHVTVQKVEDVFAEAYDAVDAPFVFGTDTETANQQLTKILVGATIIHLFTFLSSN